MPIKPTLFAVTDIETTMRKRIAFDIGWRIIDKSGREYNKGSFVIREAFRYDVPFYADKLGHYFDDAYSQLIKPASIFEVRNEYNRQIAELKQSGHRVIACAYNAAFDFKYLPHTFDTIAGTHGARWMMQPVEIMDIWDFWGSSVPLDYTAELTASGKYISTSAESAYRWEMKQADFQERHIAWHDCLIESDILLKALKRKKPMPIVSRPSELAGSVWRKINSRLGIDGRNHLVAA